MNNVSTSIRCVLCGEESSIPVRKGVRHEPRLEVRRCQDCGLVRLDPLPTEEDLKKFYAETYRTEYDPGVSPERKHNEDLPEARERVGRLGGLLNPGTSLLELGSGSGAFLHSVRPLVGRVTGIEPTVAYRRWANEKLGLEIREKLEDVEDRGFDLIVLFHVLEHVLRPVEFIESLLARLKPGGRIAVEVPDVEDALLTLYRLPAYAAFYYQNAHLWYFSKSTLERAARAAGAEADIAGVQRYDLSNHIRWLLTGKPGGTGFYGRVFPGSLNKAYAEALVRAGHADTLWAVLRKGGGRS
ncbi:MAG: class I SAM-dependent methyltransferase [Elusimicrobiota bacterium]